MRFLLPKTSFFIPAHAKIENTLTQEPDKKRHREEDGRFLVWKEPGYHNSSHCKIFGTTDRTMIFVGPVTFVVV